MKTPTRLKVWEGEFAMVIPSTKTFDAEKMLSA